MTAEKKLHAFESDRFGALSSLRLTKLYLEYSLFVKNLLFTIQFEKNLNIFLTWQCFFSSRLISLYGYSWEKRPSRS